MKTSYENDIQSEKRDIYVVLFRLKSSDHNLQQLICY